MLHRCRTVQIIMLSGLRNAYMPDVSAIVMKCNMYFRHWHCGSYVFPVCRLQSIGEGGEVSVSGFIHHYLLHKQNPRISYCTDKCQLAWPGAAVDM